MKRGRLDNEVGLARLGTQTVGAPRRLTEAKPLLVVQTSYVDFTLFFPFSF